MSRIRVAKRDIRDKRTFDKGNLKMDNRKCKNCKYGDFQNESKGVLHVVSFSGGKDSTAMLLHMLELGMPIDEVVNVDTGMEFPAMYRHIEKVRAAVETAGVKFTTLKADKTFEFYLTEVQVNRRNPKFVGVRGYGWPGPRFALEDERTEQGLTINARSKEFKDALAERLQKGSTCAVTGRTANGLKTEGGAHKDGPAGANQGDLQGVQKL